MTDIEEMADVNLADGLEDLVAALRGEIHLDVVGWWRADRLLEAAKARTGEVLDGAIAEMETEDEQRGRLLLDIDRAIARVGKPTRPVRVKKRAS